MASADNCYTPLDGFLLRVVKLDACGSPVSGAASTVMMEDFMTARFNPDWEAGKEFIRENAQGEFIVNRKKADRMKRINSEVTMGRLDPALIHVATGDGIGPDGAPIGMVFSEERNTDKFSIEVWGGTAEDLCDAGGDPLFEYLVIPWADNAHFGESTIQHDVTDPTLMFTSHRAPGFTGYSDAPPLPRAFGPKDHMMRFLTNVPPPEPAVDGVFCGYQPAAPTVV